MSTEKVKNTGVLRRALEALIVLVFLLVPVQVFAACSNPAGSAGKVIFNSSESVLQYCDNTNWIAFPKGRTAPTEGLIGHWEFEDGSGTTATDSMGTYNGTLTNMDGSDWIAGGRLGGGLDLDGTDDHIVLPSSLFTNNLTAEITIAVWFKTTTVGVIFGYQNGAVGTAAGSFVPAIYVGTDGKLRGKFWEGSAASPTDPDMFLSSASVDDGLWHHVALSSDGSRQIMYLDGVSIGEMPANIDTLSMIYNQIGAGRTVSWSATVSAWTYFAGQIDDVRLYNRALNAFEIQNIYLAAGGSGPLPSPDRCDPANFPPPGQICNDGTVYAGSSPDGNVPMFVAPNDESSSIPWNNGNATGHVATSATSDTDGDGNTALIIANDSNSDFVGNQPHQAAQLCADATTAGFDDWYLPARDELTVLYTNRIAIGNFDSSAGYWSSRENSTTEAIYKDFNSGSDGSLGKDWYHRLRCVRKGYVSKCLNPFGKTGEIRYDANHKVLQWCDGTNWQAAGETQDVADGLVAYWSMEDGSGTTAADSAGDNDGALTNGPVWNSGVLGGALEFDGLDDFVSIPNSSSVENIQEDDYTISAWFYPDQVPPGTGADYDAFYAIIAKNGNHLGLTYDYNGSFIMDHWLTGGVEAVAVSATTFPAQNWYHVTGVVDKANGTTKIYVNGVLEGTDSWTAGTAAYDYLTNLWRIGAANPATTSSYGWPADGKIDDVRIYNRALTPTEISLLAGAGCSNPAAPEGSLIYNTTHSVVQYCDGTNWRGVAKGIALPPCGSSPSPGDACSDGTVYAGLSPDGNIPMYTTRCSYGATWDGSNCSSTGTVTQWNNNNASGYVTTGTTSETDGDGNTATLDGLDSDSITGANQPHLSAQYCADLVENGRSDWYLPARLELVVLYDNRAAIGNFFTAAGSQHWSSTEASNDTAIVVNFNTGDSSGESAKDWERRFRCVRK